MRVRAISPGFFDLNKNGHPIDIKVGQEFDYPEDSKLGAWMVKVEGAPPHPAEVKPPTGGKGDKAKSVI